MSSYLRNTTLGSPDETLHDLQLVDLETAQPIGAIIHEEGEITAVAFSPESKRLAVVSSPWCRIWDTIAGKSLAPRFKLWRGLTSLDWSPDGRRIMTAGVGDFSVIWDVATGTPMLSPMWSADSRRAYFSLDGRFVEEWGVDRHVRLWDATTAEVLTPRWQQDGDIWIVRVTPSGRFVVASGDTIRTWNLKPNTFPPVLLADYAMLLAGRRLNAAGVMQPIPAIELAALCQSLRTRAPQLFE